MVDKEESDAVDVKYQSGVQGADNDKKFIYVYLFIIFIAINYFDVVGNQISDLQEVLRDRSAAGSSMLYLSSVQLWILNIMSLVGNSLVVAIATGIMAYYAKRTKIYVALLLGLSLQYLPLLAILALSVLGRRISLSDVAEQIDYVLLALSIPATLFASYLGFDIGKTTDYLDTEDRDRLYLYGMSKRIWFLVLLAYNPVVGFLSRFTVLQIYVATKNMDSIDISGLAKTVAPAVALWFAAFGVFAYGLDTIKDREANYRWLKLSCIFVLVPVITTVIATLGHETWFY